MAATRNTDCWIRLILAGRVPSSISALSRFRSRQLCRPISGSGNDQSCQIAGGHAGARLQVLMVTGGPGVGKTTLVNAILRILSAKGARLFAPPHAVAPLLVPA